MRASGIVVVAFALAVAGCSGQAPRQEPGAPRLAQGTPSTETYVSSSRAPGIPKGFGDRDPHEWGARSPDDYTVHGIDASRYQGAIDWLPARRAGVRFAWLKATEGGDHLDPGYALNAPAARAAGVPVGAYHFFYFCRDAAEQAQWFIRNVPRRKGDLPPVLDMEWTPFSPTCTARPEPAKVRASIRDFSRIITQHYGTRPVVYTTPEFYEQNGLGQMRGQEFFLRAVSAHPSEHYPGERWSFWQYSGTGVVPGVSGKVDLNAFGGSLRDWQAWLASRRQW